MTLTFISLFAGIGGIDLGLERAGMRCVAQVEVDEFCRRALAKHWPDVERHADVREYRPTRGAADVVAGGFPCQPHSAAGKRKGRDDNRNLWPEFLRIVDRVRPRWVIGENVPAIRRTLADEVLDDLAALGYCCWPILLAACDVGAPHQRERVFFVAVARGKGLEERWERARRAIEEVAVSASGGGDELADAAGRRLSQGDAAEAQADDRPRQPEPGRARRGSAGPVGRCGQLAYTSSSGRQGAGADPHEGRSRSAEGGRCELADAIRQPVRGNGHGGAEASARSAEGEEREQRLQPDHAAGRGAGCGWPSRPGEPQHEWEAPRLTESPVGAPAPRLPGGLAGRRFARWRRASLKAIGNSVVPQVAELIGWTVVMADAALAEGGAA